MKQPKPNYGRPYRFDETVSDDFMQPKKHVTSLMHNIFNMRVGNHKIGTKKWIDTAMREIRRYEFEELLGVLGTHDEPTVPLFIAKRSNSEFKNWLKERKDGALDGNDLDFPHPCKRVRKAIEYLSHRPLKSCAFVTVVTSIQLSYWDALTAAKSDGTQLVNLLNRRLKGNTFSFIFVPEVDLLTVEDIDDGLMGAANWKFALQPNRVVYKVHFHGVLYVDGMLVGDIQEALTHTNCKKRTRVFFGLNRVRAVPLYKHPQHGGRNDAEGCIGYSLKRHYRPTNKDRHLETMPEWFRLMEDIDQDHSLIRTGGIRDTVKY